MSTNNLPVVLIVEDRETDQWLINQTIRGLPLKTLVTNSVFDGKESLSQHKVDLVICDYNLQDGIGTEVLQQLIDIGQGIPFILFTGEIFSNIPEVNYHNFYFVEKSESKKLRVEVIRQLGLLTI
jgi:DNA-binding NtrC family response regulator